MTSMASGYFDERDADKPASAKHSVLNNGHIARAQVRGTNGGLTETLQSDRPAASGEKSSHIVLCSALASFQNVDMFVQALLNRISYLQNEEAKLDRDIEGTRKKTEALLSRKVECSRDQDVARAANDVLLALKSDRPSTGRSAISAAKASTRASHARPVECSATAQPQPLCAAGAPTTLQLDAPAPTSPTARPGSASYTAALPRPRICSALLRSGSQRPAPEQSPKPLSTATSLPMSTSTPLPPHATSGGGSIPASQPQLSAPSPCPPGSGPLPSLPKAAAPVVAPGCLPGDPDCSEAAAAQPASDTLPPAPAVGVPAVTAPPSASPHQPAPLPAPQPAAGAGAAVLAAARPPPRTHRKCGQAAAPTPASAPDLHAASTCGPVPQPSCVPVSQGAERAAALSPAADSPGTRAPALLQPHGHLTLLRATTGPTVGLAAAATQAIRDSAPAPQLVALPGDSPPHPPSPATLPKVQAADSGKSRQHHSGQAVSGQSLPGQLGAKSGSREGAGRHQKQPARSATKDSQAAGDSGRPRCPTPGGSCAAAGPAGLTLVTGAGGATQAAAAGASAVGAHGRGGRADLQTNSTNRMTALASERGQHLELDPEVIEELVTQPGAPTHPSAATACCQRERAPGITAFAAAEGLQHFATQPLAPRKLVTTLSASRTASSLGCVPCLGRGVPGAAAGTGLPLPLPSLPPPYPHNSAAANKAPGAAAQPSTTSSSSSTAPKQGVPTCSPGWSLSAAAEASGA
ncbi:hypothetical protein V8C86DRAFT_3022713, partial [Haematococcus lacustris]